MNKLAVGIGAVAVVAVAGVLGTSYVMGSKLEQEFKQSVADWKYPEAKPEIVSYERGVFSSQAKTRWTISMAGVPLVLDGEHAITHGPLPMGSAADIKSEFKLGESSDKQLVEAVKGQAPIQLHTKLGWNNSSEHQLDAPAFSSKHEGNELSWSASTAQWSMNADLTSMKGSAKLPALEIKEDGQSLVSLNDTNMRFDYHRPAGQKYWLGPVSFNVGNLAGVIKHSSDDEDAEEAEDQPPRTFKLQNLTMDGDSKQQGEEVNVSFKSAIKSAQFDKHNVDDIALDFDLRKIDGAWLNQIMEANEKLRQRVYAAKDKGDFEDLDVEELTAPILKSVPQLLARKPEFEIKRFSMKTPEGVTEFGATISYIGTNPQKFNPMQDLKANIRASVPKQLATSMMESRIRDSIGEMVLAMSSPEQSEAIDKQIKDMVKERSDALVSSGLLIEEGDIWKTEVSLEKTDVRVNNKPLDQQSAAALQGSIN